MASLYKALKVQHPIYRLVVYWVLHFQQRASTMRSVNHRRRSIAAMNEKIAHPGESLRVKLEERGWTQNDLATIMGRPARLVTEIVTGKRSITPETAVELGAALGTTAQWWMNQEFAYRLSQIRNVDVPKVSRRARLFALGPVNEMVKRGWLEQSQNISVLEQRFMQFVDADNLDVAPTFDAHAFRQSTPYHTDTPAQTLWLFRVRQLAGLVTATRYSKARHEEIVEGLRQLVPSPEEVRHVPRLLADAGVRLVVVEPLKSTRIDGVCFWLADDAPVVAISMRYNRIDYFWHTLMHELAHLRNQDGLANDHATVDVDVEGERQSDRTLAHERDADRIATETLVPRDALENFISRLAPLYSSRAIRGFAATNRTHAGIVVGQLQHRGEIPYSKYRQLLVPVRDFIVESALTDGWGHTISVEF